MRSKWICCLHRQGFARDDSYSYSNPGAKTVRLHMHIDPVHLLCSIIDRTYSSAIIVDQQQGCACHAHLVTHN
jgi:hypothetical protein